MATAFQVDRAIFDKIVLDRAKDLRCQVREEAKVRRVVTAAGSVKHLEMENGDIVKARYYIIASGTSGMLRRALGVECEYPTVLKNIAIWDYWQNTEWVKELQEFSGELAKSVGPELSPDKGWAWLAQGGFINEEASSGVGGFSMNFIKGSGEFLTEIAVESPVEQFNVFRLDLSGASWKDSAGYRDGRVVQDQCYIRDGRVLLVRGVFDYLVYLLQFGKTSVGLLNRICVDAEKDEKMEVLKNLLTEFRGLWAR